MSRYIQRVLGPDEQLVYTAQIHWYIYIRGLCTILAGAAFGAFFPYIIRPIIGTAGLDQALVVIRAAALITIGMGTCMTLRAYIHQISTELVLTNRRVIAKYGFIATTTFELMLARVEGANIDQTILGRLMGFGTIFVKGTGGSISPIDHIAAPYQFHAYLLKALEHNQPQNT